MGWLGCTSLHIFVSAGPLSTCSNTIHLLSIIFQDVMPRWSNIPLFMSRSMLKSIGNLFSNDLIISNISFYMFFIVTGKALPTFTGFGASSPLSDSSYSSISWKWISVLSQEFFYLAEDSQLRDYILILLSLWYIPYYLLSALDSIYHAPLTDWRVILLCCSYTLVATLSASACM